MPTQKQIEARKGGSDPPGPRASNWADLAKAWGITGNEAIAAMEAAGGNYARANAMVAATLGYNPDGTPLEGDDNGPTSPNAPVAPATAGSSSSSSGTTSGGGTSAASAAEAAKAEARAIANAQAAFTSYLRAWGMVVTPKLKKLIETAAKGQWNSQAFLIAVRGTEEYKQKFPGIQWRNGMSEASYNAQYDSFADRALDSGYRLTREGFAHILKKGIDSQEWSLRVQAVQQVKANRDLLENFRQFLVDNGQLKPREELSPKEVYKLATGRGSPAWVNLWNTASVETGLEGIGFTVGRNADLTREELRHLLKGPISKLGPGESLDMDYASLAQTAAEALPASRLYKSGITKKDLVTMALGGKNAAAIATRVQLAINTARATASEQRANPQLNQGGMQMGGMNRPQATE
jgi:hypothetical protein